MARKSTSLWEKHAVHQVMTLSLQLMGYQHGPAASSRKGPKWESFLKEGATFSKMSREFGNVILFCMTIFGAVPRFRVEPFMLKHMASDKKVSYARVRGEILIRKP